MILIIYGNDLASSRNFYFEEKNRFKNPVLINGEGITYDLVFQNAENKTFFEDKTTLLVENFFSKNKSNSIEFKKIVSFLNDKKNIDVIFWEGGEISKSSLSLFKSASAKNFSFPQTLFAFLDNIKPKNGLKSIALFHELLKNMEPELIFFMITRQLRLMLNQLDDGKQIDEARRLAPWQSSKLRNQTSLFDKDRLIDLYNKLFVIETEQKTGKNSSSMEKSIDFFLLGL